MALSNVQTLRAVAAILVMLDHLQWIGGIYPTVATFHGSYGMFGVDLFFVISGFIMAYITRHAWDRPLSFIIARVLRIYPLWWLYLFIAAPAAISAIFGRWDADALYYVKSALLFPVVDARGELSPALRVGWTLSYEMLFYLAFALVMNSRQRFVAAKIAASLIVCLVIGQLSPAGSAAQLFFGNSIYLEFILGVAIGTAFVRQQLTATVVCALLAAVPIAWQLHGLSETFRFLYYGIPAAAILTAALYLEQSGVRAPPWMSFLGDASYTIYLSHSVVMWVVAAWVAPYFSGWIALTLIGLGTLGAGLAGYVLFEAPLHRATRRMMPMLHHRYQGRQIQTVGTDAARARPRPHST